MHLILDEKVYNRLKNGFEEEYNVLLENNVSLYIYSGKIGPSSFMATDNFLLLKLFGKEGEFDHRKIISFTPSALEWGNELAQYYIDRSTKIRCPALFSKSDDLRERRLPQISNLNCGL